ncbi:16935_t:CDS:2, partial [Dentiscutata heterogama]
APVNPMATPTRYTITRPILNTSHWTSSIDEKPSTEQELIRREYLRDMGIDLGYMEPLNIQAINAERTANQRSNRRPINLNSVDLE